MVQSGIKRVVYLKHKYPDIDSFVASKRLLEQCNIEVELYKDQVNIIKIDNK